jgi:hypothetical protein
MKVTKWVDFSQMVEMDIGANDISDALSEAFARVHRDIDDKPNRFDVTSALNAIAGFFNGLTDAHIALLTDGQRKITRTYLAGAAARFAYCSHERLDEDGICRTCGADRRWI